MICFCYYAKKNQLWARSITIFFLCKLGPKNTFSEILPTFFQDSWIATQAININY